MTDPLPQLPPLPVLPAANGRPIASMAELSELRNVGQVGDYRILYQAGLSFRGHEKMGIYIAQALDTYIDKMLDSDAAEACWNDIWMRYENVDDWYCKLAEEVSDAFTGAVLLQSAVARNNVGDRL